MREGQNTGSRRERRLIITADDFGLHRSVNEAVERAHREGVLTAASLMVTAPAAADAVARARHLPDLRVGLHLVLADGQAELAPERIPALCDANGRFDDNMARAGMRFFFTRRGRRQLAAEIRAQFEAFAATGLALDHVNAHKHFHLHPTVLGLIIEIGRDYGLKAVRLPYEPLPTGRGRPQRGAYARTVATVFLAPWLKLLKKRLDKAGLTSNDYVFGLSETGQMREATLLKILEILPEGVSEVYLHPATETGLTRSMADYDHPGELDALLSARVRTALDQTGIARISFTDLN